MTLLPKRTIGTDKGQGLLQLFNNKSKLRNGTKTFLEPIFFSIYGQI